MTSTLYDICVVYLAKNVHLINFTTLPSECVNSLREEITFEKLGGSTLIRLCHYGALLRLLVIFQPTSPLLTHIQCWYVGEEYFDINEIDDIDITFNEFRAIKVKGIYYNLKPNILNIRKRDLELCRRISSDTPEYNPDSIAICEKHINDSLRDCLDECKYISKSFKVLKSHMINEYSYYGHVADAIADFNSVGIDDRSSLRTDIDSLD